MQTALRIIQGGIGKTDYPFGRISRHPKGDIGTQKKSTASTGKRHAFLTEKIAPIAPDFKIRNRNDDAWVNLTTPENFDYLYQSALNYAGLMGIKLPFRYRKGGSPRLKISELYNAMDGSVPECVNLEEKNGRLHFCLFRYHDWPEPALFWIPVGFTELLPVALKRIAKEFIRRFVRHHGVSPITDSYYFDMGMDELKDWGNRDSDASPKEIRENSRLADSYLTGKRAKALKRIYGKPFCYNLEERIRQYRIENKKERELLDLIKEGMALITPESPCLIGYLYDWAYEESPDINPIGMEQQLMLVYSDNDTLAECMRDYMNSDYRETYALTPVTYRYLTPETNELFHMDDYPERLSEWLERFTEHINDNFKNEKA
ncbi:hypothetical protein [Parabacteroides johnsonii]|uniref:hypothetical protein n=1 Tax=Parabacteroides johnsonii TaxID=387661 RepID=UPI00189C24AA|nr:hypothetical protein [Parabacteroides johnsonii]